MAYPKPLSEKTIIKRYKEAGLDESKITFIRTFFKACANLYGAIAIRDIWDIYKEVASKEGYLKLKRQDFTNAATIMRREPNEFYVYEAEDIYYDVRNSALTMEIIHSDLIWYGFNRNFPINQLKEHDRMFPFYIPNHILEYADSTKLVTEEEKKLADFLGDLTVNSKEYEHRYTHKMLPCHGTMGVKLSKLICLTNDETYELKYENGEFKGKKKNEKEYLRIKNKYERPVSEKLMNYIKEWEHAEAFSVNKIIEAIYNDLNEIGVMFDEKQMMTFVDLYMSFHNHFHMWALDGWCPVEVPRG